MNDQKGNNKAPNYKGKINVAGKDYDLAGWKRIAKNGSEYISLMISEQKEKA